MAEIKLEFPRKIIVLTNWYQNMGYEWVRASNTISHITIYNKLKHNSFFENTEYYDVLFAGDKEIIELGIFYKKLFKNNLLKNLYDTQDQVDDFLINKFPKFKNLLIFS